MNDEQLDEGHFQLVLTKRRIKNDWIMLKIIKEMKQNKNQRINIIEQAQNSENLSGNLMVFRRSLNKEEQQCTQEERREIAREKPLKK